MREAAVADCHTVQGERMAGHGIWTRDATFSPACGGAGKAWRMRKEKSSVKEMDGVFWECNPLPAKKTQVFARIGIILLCLLGQLVNQSK